MSQKVQVWQEQQGKPVYRFQTDDHDLSCELVQQKEFDLVGWGVNVNLWIHRAEFQSIQKAQQAVRRFQGKGEL